MTTSNPDRQTIGSWARSLGLGTCQRSSLLLQSKDRAFCLYTLCLRGSWARYLGFGTQAEDDWVQVHLETSKSRPPSFQICTLGGRAFRPRSLSGVIRPLRRPAVRPIAVPPSKVGFSGSRWGLGALPKR